MTVRLLVFRDRLVGIDPSLFYKGKEVNGLSLGKVGFSGSSATGKVYNLKTLAEFDGHYVGAGTGMTVAGGRSRLEMKNQNGVQVYLTSASKGLDVSLGRGGVEMSLKKEASSST